MKQRLGCVLLIDDDDATNYINERLINKLECTGRIVKYRTAYQALEYIKEHLITDENCQGPILILLDLNMPVMNGWEFVEEYNKLQVRDDRDIKLVVLTTSMNPDDRTQALATDGVNDFVNKPLTAEALQGLIERNFA